MTMLTRNLIMLHVNMIVLQADKNKSHIWCYGTILNNTYYIDERDAQTRLLPQYKNYFFSPSPLSKKYVKNTFNSTTQCKV